MTERDGQQDAARELSRREFLAHSGVGLGSIALGSLLRGEERDGSPRPPHHRPRAKNVIFLFMAGGPSQLDLFDPKPELVKRDGQAPPSSMLEGKRFAFIDSKAKLLGSERKFAQHGECGTWVSELLPHTAGVVDDITVVRSMVTDAINHGPAKLMTNTGTQLFGRPSMGAWANYGLGSEAHDLPGFVVLQSGIRGPRIGAPLWSNGFLPPRFQGVPFRSGGDPILHLSDPPGYDRAAQRRFFDAVGDLNRQRLESIDDDEIRARIAAYELAFRMQASAPELIDLASEPQHVLEMYGAVPGHASFNANCLLARRMVERGVRFVQLYHTDWDHHGAPDLNVGKPLEQVCLEIDLAAAALIKDLKQRGMLDETLVIWGGEFGRTPMAEVRTHVGRDHMIDGYTLWLAGGGVKAGHVFGETDELGLGVARDAVHVHDLQATILHLLGLDHERLTYRFQGRDFRLTDVAGEVVEGILA